MLRRTPFEVHGTNAKANHQRLWNDTVSHEIDALHVTYCPSINAHMGKELLKPHVAVDS